MRPETEEHNVLNQIIANISQLKINVQQIHWYMRGQDFFKLHPLMDDYQDQLSDQLDEIAERLISIGGEPYSTVHEFLDHSEIKDEKIKFGEYSLPELVERLVKDWEILREQYTKGILLTDKVQDFATQDILNGFQAECDKNIWMLKAFLDQPVRDSLD
ncbi:MAG: DNA starvation/stationary phase protection protein [Firmicutes bacterium]|uniref:DNA starvation/stationary phase protection protein n=1 Tax=Candidatus Gallilactobacillus intestinavium TaxID=2840838 RepID=A0A9D9H7G2_9LACO|nr:DNA starvation/stationary phase protection protein [Candidatus Gallilactobacillus intestinavium]